MTEPNWLVQGLLAGGLGGISLLFGQWVTRKNFRENLVQDAKKIDNTFTLDAFKAIQEESASLRRELRERIGELEREVNALRDEVEASRSERELLHTEYVRLHNNHDKLLIEHTQLRIEHQNLKTEHEALKQRIGH